MVSITLKKWSGKFLLLLFTVTLLFPGSCSVTDPQNFTLNLPRKGDIAGSPIIRPFAISANSGIIEVEVSSRIINPSKNYSIFKARIENLTDVDLISRRKNGSVEIVNATFRINSEKHKPGDCIRVGIISNEKKPGLLSNNSKLCFTSFPITLSKSNAHSKNIAISPDDTKAISNEILIWVKDNTPEKSIHSLLDDINAKVIGTYLPTNLYQLRLNRSHQWSELTSLLKQLNTKEIIKNVALNVLTEPAAATDLPDDNTSGQTGLKTVILDPANTGRNSWAIRRDALTEIPPPASTVELAVLDMGVDGTHSDFQIPTAGCRLSECTDTDNTDTRRHGTKVTGVLAAISDNNTDIAGIADNSDGVNFYPINGIATVIDIVDALILADGDTGTNLDIINISYGASLFGSSCDEPISFANSGRLLIASVGNHNGSTPKFPANCTTSNHQYAVDQTLTADTSNINDNDGLGLASDFTYQWLRGGSVIPGANNQEYELVADDIGELISVKFNYNNNGNEDELFSAPSKPIVDSNSSPTDLPIITNTSFKEGEYLLIDTDDIADSDSTSPLEFSYQWLRNNSSISGATNNTYQLDDADVGTQISVRVGFIDGGGTYEFLTSDQTPAVENINDSPTGYPSITGTVTSGQTVSADTSGIIDNDGVSPAAFDYQWLRDGLPIFGSNLKSYTLDPTNDANKMISVSISYTDEKDANEGPLVSQAISASGTNVPSTVAPVISSTGTITEDETLTADTSGLSDTDGLPSSFTYQWLRDGNKIYSANNEKYKLDDADVGSKISVRVSYTDDGGTHESITSSETTDVINVNDRASGYVSMPGTADNKRIISVASATDSCDASGCKYGTLHSGTDGSNFNANGGNWVDFAAPGVSIPMLLDGGGTGTETGTSYSAPLVAGAAAMLQSCGVNIDDIQKTLLVSAPKTDLKHTNPTSIFHSGINAFSALKYHENNTFGPLILTPPTVPYATLSCGTQTANTDVGIFSTNTLGACNTVESYNVDNTKFSIDNTSGQLIIIDGAILTNGTPEHLTVTVTDVFGRTDNTTFSLICTSPNTPPIANDFDTDGIEDNNQDISITIDEDQTHTFSDSDFGFHDTDSTLR